MRYYVVSDIHGFCAELKQTLRKAGYFVDSKPHKLVLLGDLLDRGEEALEMEEFILTLMKRDELILIRGDHEDLFEEFVTGHWQRDFLTFVASGTYDSTLQLTDYTNYRVLRDVKRFFAEARESDFYRRILPAMRDYYETRNHVFVHGSLPGRTMEDGGTDWRNAPKSAWAKARRTNGADTAQTVCEGKTIIRDRKCGAVNVLVLEDEEFDMAQT